MTKTSWQNVSQWYTTITRGKGHYFHEHLVVPKTLTLLNLRQGDAVLDVACGTGVFGHAVPAYVSYTGIDIAKNFIQEARKQDNNKNHTYIVADVTKPFPIPNDQLFSHAVCILSVQNIEDYSAVFKNTARVLRHEGMFVIVLNHPMFRIPRQTSWEFDENNKIQYRRVNRYLSPLKIPINVHPSKQHKSPIVWAFHYPLSSYITGLRNAGFVITHIEEWVSDKESEGKFRKMENRARNEIPLFMTIVAKKL
ncbi:MAG: class I SAM-dependent methyltransferase [Patescibacteria group bacterium]|nr:class I SAM-dependent methyltransferase [Patescibacteria group bacterium]